MQTNLFDGPHPVYLFSIIHCLRAGAGSVSAFIKDLSFILAGSGLKSATLSHSVSSKATWV
jgi:hypothetical protein